MDGRLTPLGSKVVNGGWTVICWVALNQLACHQHQDKYTFVDENPRQKADVDTKVEHKEGTRSNAIVGSSSVFTNMVTSALSVKNSKDNFSVDNTVEIKSSVIRSKPFIPKLAIAETPSVVDKLGKSTYDAPVPLNIAGFEPGSGHTDRSVSSISSRSDIDLSSARSLHEFNTIIDHLTSTAAKLSDNLSGRNSARGVDATFTSGYGSTSISNVVETVAPSVTGRETKKTPRLVHWTSKNK